MNITVNAQEPVDNVMTAEITVSAEDVNREIQNTYREIGKHYTFKGFRRGRTPRPVIDAQVGRANILMDATDALVVAAQPAVLNELDVVPMAECTPEGELGTVEEGEAFVYTLNIPLPPEAPLSNYEPVSIEMPPEEVTDAELAERIDQFVSAQATPEEITDAPIEMGDYVTAKIEDKGGAEAYAGESQVIVLGSGVLPSEVDDALIGLKPGDVTEVSFMAPAASEDDEDAEPQPATMEITVTTVYRPTTPELTNQFVSDMFGFASVKEFADAITQEIEQSKAQQLPRLKEDRALNALAERLEIEEVPQEFIQDQYEEIVRSFSQDLQQTGMSIENFLALRRITMDQLIQDMQLQAAERSRHTLALNAVVREKGYDATDEDIDEELGNAGITAKEVTLERMTNDGQMPTLRAHIRRNKALEWLLDTAEVTIVDEIAQRREEEGKTLAYEIPEPDEDDEAEVEVVDAADAPQDAEVVVDETVDEDSDTE